jgi:hypothetical protein
MKPQEHTQATCCFHLQGEGGIKHQGLSVKIFFQKKAQQNSFLFSDLPLHFVFWMKRQKICNSHKGKKKAAVMK